LSGTRVPNEKFVNRCAPSVADNDHEHSASA
jgi:hypothetical protein